MNRKKYIPFTIILFLTSMHSAYAVCSNEEILEFKKVEDEYKITYEFIKETKDYNVTFYLPEPDKYGYIIDELFNTQNFLNNIDKTFTYSRIKPGEYKMELINRNPDCKGKLKTIELKLDKYNKYSEDELCKGIEEFVLCQPTYGKEIDYETFVSRINTYKNKKNNQKEELPEVVEENKIIEYIKENITEIIIISIFIILVIITTIIGLKSSRKSRRL